jgi:hypothetical protein
MEPEDSLPYSQEPSIGPYTEPDQSSPHHHHPISLGPILILSTHLRLGLSSYVTLIFKNIINVVINTYIIFVKEFTYSVTGTTNFIYAYVKKFYQSDLIYFYTSHTHKYEYIYTYLLTVWTFLLFRYST